MPTTYTLISSTTLTSSQSTITFSSIPNTYTDLVLKASTRDTNATIANGQFLLRFNGDSATNYSYLRVYSFNGTTVNSGINANIIYIMPGATALDTAGNTANTFASVDIYIPNYTSTTTKAVGSFEASENNTVGNIYLGQLAGSYRNSTAISSISIAATTAFDINSSFYLYGIKNS